ncbi:PfkB family carbohydrate kinase [Streptomyces pseudovenezuelae]|uniref:Sugar/nucleoside kinase (Ribokinase family) n=1 Tax=Streptomyces pseudovenezuelae TaxID=67350 RepID=A0ABT6LRR7_9ACTN|nr:PfkB family carbohydrate kinase [Streptomyces pseudovenezuelae]MDH6219017.1 sugar/nucleoside kinase (ribokinase family) [Streptomyces pseudovenezuelae]
MSRLFHLGNAVVDLVLTVPALPERGGEVLATRTETTPGGGFNVMAAAARQGLPVIYAGAHGTGPFGDRVRAALRAEGVDVLLPPRQAPDTGFVVCLVDAEGERTFVTSPGAEATLTAVDLAELRPGPGDLAYVSGYGLLYESNRAALTGWLTGLSETVTVVADPGPLVGEIPVEARELLLARADWWSCNAREAILLTGTDTPAEAAHALYARLPRGSALVRTGPDGCLLHHDGTLTHIPGFPVHAVDLNGAGDAHTGVFIASLAQGLTPLRAARRANAAAALAVTRRGPATAPDGMELDGFLAGRDQD